jgi:hypothetical protein
MRLLIGAAGAGLALLVAAPPVLVQAQRQRVRQQPVAVDSDVARARELYASGLAAIDDSRWADALGIFRESYTLSPTTPALFNVALVLRALGRVRESRDTFAQLLGALGEADPIHSAASVMRAEAASRVVALILEGLPARGVGRLRLDGSLVLDPGTRPFVLEADPGTHALAVDAPGYDPFEWRGELRDGQRERVHVVLEEPGAPIWPWLAGGGALVATAVLVAVLVATRNTDSDIQLPRAR